MRCEEVKALMAEYIDDTLEAETREEVAGHLDICDGCFNEIKALDKTMWTLEESSRNITVPTGFLDSVEERAVKKHKPVLKSIKKVLRVAVYAAIFAAAAGAIFWGVRSIPKIVR